MSRVFISYGRADAENLALRLEEDLRDRGHDVWLDRHEIKAGRAWEEEIEKGILGSDVVIALLSPHAVRRPDGVCLDEISLARYSRRRIIPAMVIPCRPPLGIYRLDRIDFQNWDIAANYDRAFTRLTRSLQEETASVEGTYAAVFSRLGSVDFGKEIARLTRRFVGRQWLFDQIDQWLRHDDSRVFMVTGEPGIGKSAALASLIQRHPQVCAYHFCVADLADSLDPFLFVRSIAAQLATQLDSYRSALEAIDLQTESEADPGALLRRLVADPLRSDARDTPVVIVVDALDESLGYVGRNIATLLSERLDDLPSSVRIVASSRDNAEILDLFSDHRARPIPAKHDDNLADASSYLALRLSEPRLSELLRKHEVPASAVAERILAKSQGNFLYLRHTLDALQAGQIDPRNPDAFPDGLVGVYYSFFQRIFPNAAGYSRFRPLLDVVIASREPMDASQIGACVNLDPFDVERELQLVADFFPEREGRYQAFHKSMVDWLLGAAGHSRRFRVNKPNGHRLIAAHYWQEYRGGADAMSDRAVQHGLYHLHCAGRPADEARLTTDPAFIRRRMKLGRGIFLSHSFRLNEAELVRHVVHDLGEMGHTVFAEFPTNSDDEWRQHLAANIPSMSIVIGFTYTRNSPYLREEWRVARESGVPVVLIIAEDSPWLSHTPELAGVPCFDMRQWRHAPTDYAAAVSQLSALIGEGEGEGGVASGGVIRVQVEFTIGELKSDDDGSTDR